MNKDITLAAQAITIFTGFALSSWCALAKGWCKEQRTMFIWPKKIHLCRIKFNLNLISLEKLIAKDASFRWLVGRRARPARHTHYARTDGCEQHVKCMEKEGTAERKTADNKTTNNTIFMNFCGIFNVRQWSSRGEMLGEILTAANIRSAQNVRRNCQK